MANSVAMIPFGDLVNAGIQTIKKLCKRANGITPKAFEKNNISVISVLRYSFLSYSKDQCRCILVDQRGQRNYTYCSYTARYLISEVRVHKIRNLTHHIHKLKKTRIRRT